MIDIKIDDIVIVVNWYSDMFGKLGRVTATTDNIAYFWVQFKEQDSYGAFYKYKMYFKDLAILSTKEVTE